MRNCSNQTLLQLRPRKQDPAVIVMVVCNVTLIVVVMVGGTQFCGGGLLQFFLEPLFDLRVLAIGFDLLDLERYSETLGKVAFGHREVASFRCSGIEMLVVPEGWRRKPRGRLSIKPQRTLI